MNALERHDIEIENTLIALTKAFNNKSWFKVYDLAKYLNRLVKERKEYIRNRKGENKNDK